MCINEEYLEEDFIIWNAQYGRGDCVTISHIKIEKTHTDAWLDEPYEMVGPFNLDRLYKDGQIRFAACVVMRKSKWEQDKNLLYKDSLKRKKEVQKKFDEEIRNYNQKKNQYFYKSKENEEKKYRKLLSLPLEGKLEVSQIKIAYRKIVKKVHPDVGGTEALFIKITEAKDILLQK